MTQSRLFPMKISLLTYGLLAPASIFTSPLATPQAPTPPCQPLTLHIQTSLDKLEALEHPLGVLLLLPVFMLQPPAPPFSKSYLPCKVRLQPRLLSEAWSSLPVLGAFRTCVRNCSNHRIRICLPPRQNSASLNVDEMGPLCVP